MKNCVLTIGKFEGVHLGHQALLKEVVSRAEILNTDSLAVVFNPHPFKFLRDADYKPIFTETERDRLIKKHGITEIYSYKFDAGFAAMKARDFCKKLFDDLNPVEIIVGEDYFFGHNREGTVETLRETKAEVRVIKCVSVSEIISSSQIREFLNEKNFGFAEKLLGFPFFIIGDVAKGRQLGRVLGFPTLNIYPDADKYLPQNGVYASRTVIGGASFTGLTNIGVRPTVSNEMKISVETHIPGFNPAEMYGRQIKVELLRFIRPERRFETTGELQAQIEQDIKRLKGE